MLNAAYGILAILPLALCVGQQRDGGVTASRPGSIAESASNTGDSDARIRRLRAKRAQRRREQREFRA
jgi:hypothetical protein